MAGTAGPAAAAYAFVFGEETTTAAEAVADLTDACGKSPGALPAGALAASELLRSCLCSPVPSIAEAALGIAVVLAADARNADAILERAGDDDPLTATRASAALATLAANAQRSAWLSSDDENARVGDVLGYLGHPDVLQMFEDYAAAFAGAVQSLGVLMRSRADFGDYVRECDASLSAGPPLRDLLLAPMLRVPYYANIVAEVARSTWPEHPDARDLQRGSGALRAAADALRDRARQAEDLVAMLALSSVLRRCPVELVEPGRRVLLEGPARVTGAVLHKRRPRVAARKRGYLHLLDDVLLVSHAVAHSRELKCVCVIAVNTTAARVLRADELPPAAVAAAAADDDDEKKRKRRDKGGRKKRRGEEEGSAQQQRAEGAEGVEDVDLTSAASRTIEICGEAIGRRADDGADEDARFVCEVESSLRALQWIDAIDAARREKERRYRSSSS
eukprot:m51a1_g10170 hypothetical protein (449) ;mRNA; f:104737-109016